jgi:death-on-curing protein
VDSRPCALESALAQPRATFAGSDLYSTIPAKAAALGHSLALNHPSVDGNKRVAHAAMEVFLNLNGFRLEADIDEQEQLMLNLAAGRSSLQALEHRLHQHIEPEGR